VSAMRRRTTVRLLVIGLVVALVAGCGDQDPGPMSLQQQLSADQQRQDYVDGVGRALGQLGSAQGPTFAQSVDNGNKRELQAAAIAWRQGMQQLKSLSPPPEAAEGHRALLNAVEALDSWNERIVNAAPNRNRTQALARQAAESPASRLFERAVCQLVDEGYEVVDPGACTPMSNAAGPAG
jgi:hypothetical protein